MFDCYFYLSLIGIIIVIYIWFVDKTSLEKSHVNPNLNIERICLKSFLSPHEFSSISKNSCLIPSYLNGRTLETNYTTYFEYPNQDIYINRIYHNKSLPAVIRIRSYMHTTEKYLELKYNGVKIRGLLDSDNNLLSTENYKDKKILYKYLKEIKTGEIKPVVSNSYDRYSFTLNKYPDIRITIDAHLMYDIKGSTYTFDQYIIELKIPKSYSQQDIDKINNYLKSQCGLHLDFVKFSKFDYGYTFIPH